jgi:hypothetical protein
MLEGRLLSSSCSFKGDVAFKINGNFKSHITFEGTRGGQKSSSSITPI